MYGQNGPRYSPYPGGRHNGRGGGRRGRAPEAAGVYLDPNLSPEDAAAAFAEAQQARAAQRDAEARTAAVSAAFNAANAACNALASTFELTATAPFRAMRLPGEDSSPDQLTQAEATRFSSVVILQLHGIFTDCGLSGRTGCLQDAGNMLYRVADWAQQRVIADAAKAAQQAGEPVSTQPSDRQQQSAAAVARFSVGGEGAGALRSMLKGTILLAAAELLSGGQAEGCPEAAKLSDAVAFFNGWHPSDTEEERARVRRRDNEISELKALLAESGATHAALSAQLAAASALLVQHGVNEAAPDLLQQGRRLQESSQQFAAAQQQCAAAQQQLAQQQQATAAAHAAIAGLQEQVKAGAAELAQQQRAVAEAQAAANGIQEQVKARAAELCKANAAVQALGRALVERGMSSEEAEALATGAYTQQNGEAAAPPSAQ
ncbi:hypothetical protein MNEG_13282 [Monoraphidium neglectum]|uniref:Uncharacterized protein n=1 Tax=Monoraphidium neglectum TaxID=145388 RepID=A0A0D2LZ75_9CHLO|nr:hypothetical protein MNEG_13282 [Monoraphidium neglectum]KIY94681.1 hypothetical protein MNEG_13282 [Monoraphidium neglectum]|eukprot:XP_013893701.1 hypothetical protein MNEG_13282 [Monoraphidium neglectum]